MLVGAAEIVDWNNRMQGNGLVSKGTEIDWAALMRFKRTFTEPVPKSKEQWLANAGIVPFHGRARLVDKTAVIVGDDTPARATCAHRNRGMARETGNTRRATFNQKR